MQRMLSSSPPSKAFFVLTALLVAGSAAHGADTKPPKEFTTVFNGKDLTGWHGMPHFDPYKLAAMPGGQTHEPRSKNGPRTRRSTGPSTTANWSTTATALI